MTEIKRIRRGLAREGRSAYNLAKRNSYAFIAVGNSIYRMSADGSREKVCNLKATKVKAKCKEFTI